MRADLTPDVHIPPTALITVRSEPNLHDQEYDQHSRYPYNYVIHNSRRVQTGSWTQHKVSHLSRPSWAAAPPGMILVMKMLGSSPTWGLSVPPAMLKPRPEFPCSKRAGGREKKKKRSWRVKAAHPPAVRPEGSKQGQGKQRASSSLHSLFPV